MKMHYKTNKEKRASIIGSLNEVLILVHPDCVIELPVSTIKEYTKRVFSAINKYNTIIHLFFSNGFGENLSDEKKELYKKLREILMTADVVMISDHKNMYSGSFKKELPDWIIDHKGGTIRIGGGYKDLCVRKTKEMLSGLGWLLKEQEISVVDDESLTFSRQMGNGNSLLTDEND